jgi:glutathione peroxidase
MLQTKKSNTRQRSATVGKSLCTALSMDARILLEENMRAWWQTSVGILLCTQLWCTQSSLAFSAPAAKHKSVYDYSLVALDGKELSLAAYKGKVILIVNLASKSIYSNQLPALEQLQKTYADKGLVVIGIPSTDFGAQELTENAAIQKYYQDTAHVSFPVFSKACLRGKDAIPLVHFLTDPKEGTPGGDIHWNFTKFLIDREGKPLLRFETDSDPSDPEFRVKLEQVLDGTYKKKDAGGKENKPAPVEDDDDGGGGE